jgi:hypothetical protein
VADVDANINVIITGAEQLNAVVSKLKAAAIAADKVRGPDAVIAGRRAISDADEENRRRIRAERELERERVRNHNADMNRIIARQRLLDREAAAPRESFAKAQRQTRYGVTYGQSIRGVTSGDVARGQMRNLFDNSPILPGTGVVGYENQRTARNSLNVQRMRELVRTQRQLDTAAEALQRQRGNEVARNMKLYPEGMGMLPPEGWEPPGRGGDRAERAAERARAAAQRFRRGRVGASLTGGLQGVAFPLMFGQGMGAVAGGGMGGMLGGAVLGPGGSFAGAGLGTAVGSSFDAVSTKIKALAMELDDPAKALEAVAAAGAKVTDSEKAVSQYLISIGRSGDAFDMARNKMDAAFGPGAFAGLRVLQTSQSEFQAAITKISGALGQQLLPTIVALTDYFTELAKAAEPLAGVLTGLADVFGYVTVFIGNNVKGFLDIVQGFSKGGVLGGLANIPKAIEDRANAQSFGSYKQRAQGKLDAARGGPASGLQQTPFQKIEEQEKAYAEMTRKRDAALGMERESLNIARQREDVERAITDLQTKWSRTLKEQELARRRQASDNLRQSDQLGIEQTANQLAEKRRGLVSDDAKSLLDGLSQYIQQRATGEADLRQKEREFQISTKELAIKQSQLEEDTAKEVFSINRQTADYTRAVEDFKIKVADYQYQRAMDASKLAASMQSVSGMGGGSNTLMGVPGVTEYLTGDSNSSGYEAKGHGGEKYHEHIAFASKALYDLAKSALQAEGVIIGSEFRKGDPGWHGAGLAFDVPASQVPIGQEQALSRKVRGIVAKALGGSVSSGGGTSSGSSLQQLAEQAGFSRDMSGTMAAIAMAESGGRAGEHNTKFPDNSYGLWQINMLDDGPRRRNMFGIQGNNQLFDPLTNAKAAKKIYDEQGLNAWSTYRYGLYKPFLGKTNTYSGGASSMAGGGASPEAILRTPPTFQAPSGAPTAPNSAGFLAGSRADMQADIKLQREGLDILRKITDERNRGALLGAVSMFANDRGTLAGLESQLRVTKEIGAIDRTLPEYAQERLASQVQFNAKLDESAASQRETAKLVADAKGIDAADKEKINQLLIDGYRIRREILETEQQITEQTQLQARNKAFQDAANNIQDFRRGYDAGYGPDAGAYNSAYRQFGPEAAGPMANVVRVERRQQEAVGDAQAISGALTGAFVDAIKGGNFSQAIGNALSEIGGRLIERAFRPLEEYLMSMLTRLLAPSNNQVSGAASGLTGLLGAGVSALTGAFGGGGGAVGGFVTGGLFNSVFSYAGGGSTGSGPRSGGVDGQGGFPAILHPNETVIDHQAPMSRYSPANNARSTAGVASDGEASSGGHSDGNGATPTIRVDTNVINSVEYATIEQLRQASTQASIQGAKMGEQRTLKRMQYSSASRRRLGL